MAKIIKYQFSAGEVNRGTEEEPNIEQVILDKEIECETETVFDANYSIAEKDRDAAKLYYSKKFYLTDGTLCIPEKEETEK